MKNKLNRVIKCATCLVTCFMLVVAGMASPANAVSILPGCYDPADYIHDITISDETKIIRYDFSYIRYGFRYWDNGTLKAQEFTDNFSVQVEARTEHVVACYPFGVVPIVSNLDSRGGALYVGDILPGSPIDFDFAIEVTFEWENESYPFDMTVSYEPTYLLYDDAGQLIDTVNLAVETVVYTLGDGFDNPATTTLSEFRHITGSIPANASYVMPFYRLRAKNPADEQLWLTLSVQGLHTSLSVDINTILENSNQMHAINDKLQDIITGTPEQNENADDALGDVEDQKDKIEDLIDQSKPNKPNTDHIDTDINAIAGDEATSLFADGMSAILNNSLILGMLSIVSVVCFIGYVLFGKVG